MFYVSHKFVASSDCDNYYCSKGGSQIREYKEQQDVYRGGKDNNRSTFNKERDHFNWIISASNQNISQTCQQKQIYFTRCLEILQLSYGASKPGI